MPRANLKANAKDALRGVLPDPGFLGWLADELAERMR